MAESFRSPLANGFDSLCLMKLRLPFRDPAPLADLNRVGDAELQARLTNDWAGIESLLRTFIPANVDFGPPVPLGFYGPWSSCLQSHGLAACREHITQLIGIMERKRPE
ncbi:MAG: hypothetical protein JWR21_2855 [Herminiimonas sp.]|nr:hypothetical protein [Herminiimonas sp.]